MIFRSPHPEVDIPLVSVTDYFLERIETFADRPALVDGFSGRTLTFSELASSIRGVAGGLQRRGLEKGDVCAIYSANTPDYAAIFHGIAHAGGVITTASPLFTADELARQLNDSNAKYLIAAPEVADKAREAAARSEVREFFVIGEGGGARSFDRLLRGDFLEPSVTIDPQSDLAALPYSSGTTGGSKGVMLTHHNLVANMCQMEGVQDLYRIGEKDTIVGVLPFFHIYGLSLVLNYGLSRGARVITMPRFNIDDFISILHDYGVTMAHVVPPILMQLARHPDLSSFDLTSLRIINSGGAPLGKEMALEASERIGCIVVQGYGLTETSPVTHSGLDVPEKYRPGSIGPGIPNTETKVLDVVTGKVLGPGETGELLIRGPQVMKGYLNQPEATADTIDEEGWLYTGDIGRADEEGHFFVVDRLKEIIKYKGYQVAPAELEDLLVTHPSIVDAAVIGIPDSEAGELPKAFVVRSGKLTPVEVMAYVRARVAPHKKIRLVEFVSDIPRATSGKILRRLLRSELTKD